MLRKFFLPFTAVALLCALASLPHDFYTLLRFLVCPVCLLSAYRAWQNHESSWAWLFGISGVLFNPLGRIHLERPTWAVLNLFLAAGIVAFLFRKPAKSVHESKA